MQILEGLYLQNALVVWMAAGALIVAFGMALGSRRAIFVAAAAAAVGLARLAGLRLGLLAEIGLFAGLSAAALGASLWFARGGRARGEASGRASSRASGKAALDGVPDGRESRTAAVGAGRLVLDWSTELGPDEAHPAEEEAAPVLFTELGGERRQGGALR
jgi:hypothetical protein